jgi:hypothetical protein
MAPRSSASSRGDEQDAQLRPQGFKLVAQGNALVLRQRPHFAIRRRIVDQRLNAGELGLRLRQLARLGGHRIQLGKLARQPHEIAAIRPGGQHGGDGLVAMDQGAQAPPEE